MEDRNFHPLEKVFNRIIDKYIRLYAAKNCQRNTFRATPRSETLSLNGQSQIETDRIILASDFSNYHLMQFSSLPTSFLKTTSKCQNSLPSNQCFQSHFGLPYLFFPFSSSSWRVYRNSKKRVIPSGV